MIALLDAIKAHPDEDTPRLILADWLDEQDDRFDAGRAAFIRREAAGTPRAKQSTTEQVRQLDRARRDEADLLRRWLEPLKPFIAGWTFDRGLPHLTVEGPSFLKPEFQALLATEAFAFVQFVHLTEAGGPRMEAMAALPEFRHVPGLSVDPFNALGTQSAANFFGSPNLTGLRQISFRSVKPGAVGMHALASNPALARLRKLNLAHNKLVDKAAAALAGSPHLANLTHLNLADNKIGDKGAEALASSPHLAGLCELDLRDNPRLTSGGKAVLAARFGSRAVS